MRNYIEQFREIGLSGDQIVIDETIARFEEQREKVGLTIEGIACLRALTHPNDVSIFDSMEIFKPQ